jgi:hypothetical protein
MAEPLPGRRARKVADFGGLIVQMSHEHQQTWWYFNGGLAQTDGESFADFPAQRRVMDVADLNVTLVRGIDHKMSDLRWTDLRWTGVVENTQRRAVTRRACWIFAPEPGFRKQEAAKSGQICVEHFEVVVARTSSLSPFARTATSPASTLGAKPGSAITEAPRSVNIARAERDLTILWAADSLAFIPLLLGISVTTT